MIFNGGKKVNELFAFKNIPLNSKIVVCGAGTFEQHLVKRIQNGNRFDLIGWVDNLYDIYKKVGLSVESMTLIDKLEYDFILIAFINEKNANNIKNKLINYGIPNDKILTVSHYIEHPIKDILKKFDFEI